MFISKFCAFNYRSLKQVMVRLENGKNVIVGKNNSGKSNIIRGLDILISEKFPTYQHFTDNDFYTYVTVDEDTGEIIERVSDDFYIEATLEGRDFDEDLIKEIKKKTAFCKIKSRDCLYKVNENGEVEINFSLFQNLDDLENRKEIETLETYSNGKEIKTLWLDATKLLEFIKKAKTFKLFFSRSRADEEKSGFGIICVDEANALWITPFLSKKFRDSLITTTIISASRSQKEDLRLVHYTWFGKLIQGLWNDSKDGKPINNEKTYKELIKEKSGDIKNLVDQVFSKETNEITELLSGAIAHKNVSFKFLNDTQDEIYKSIQLFVNDGIDRPLFEKGTGIQSAIIIALFSLYCSRFHHASSLLIVEEPELYLHPQARRVISAELEKFLDSSETQERQLIINTHSIEYLKNVEPYNIIRVQKDEENNCSITTQLDSNTSKEITTELKRFIWSNNTELFFADKVILVEGAEVYLISAIVDKLKGERQLLDYNNITVTRVNGKGNFLTYIKILDCFGIEYLILGDLDCFKDEVSKLTSYLKISDHSAEIDKIQKALVTAEIDYKKLHDRIKGISDNTDAQALKSVFEKFASGVIEKSDSELLQLIEYMKSKYSKGNAKDSINSAVGDALFQNIQTMLKDNNIFIWSQGELEDYYTKKVIQMAGGKDIKALELAYHLQSEEGQLSDYFLHIDELELLCAKILEGFC